MSGGHIADDPDFCTLFDENREIAKFEVSGPKRR
jgi:hypothetical protein